MAAPALSLSHITKRFGALLANDDISLDLHAGEVLALLGENGAGKSTLVSVLFGHHAADAGTITAFGELLPPGDTGAALAAGIGMVHQHFTLADAMSVLDNVVLGAEPLWQPFSRRAAARASLLATAERFGLRVDPDARVGTLSVGERQRVEILKALVPRGRRRAARILVLDEPTAVLTLAEAESLFATLRQLVAQGLGVILISHKLDEVLRVSDRVAVLRGGRLVATLAAAGTDRKTLAALMVGREVARPVRAAAPAAGAVVCALRGVGVGGGTAAHAGATAGGERLDGIDLDLRAGEIVAIAGVSGNGQQALAGLLFGLRRPDRGVATLGGAPLPSTPAASIAAGVARIPEDRQAAGSVGDLPVWENAVLDRHATPAFSRAGFIRRGAARAHAQRLVERFDVRGLRGRGLDTPARVLSGGNLQKLVLGRALLGGDGSTAMAPRLIVADQPTWGLDVGAVAFVHQQLLDAAAGGAAVLLISEDLDEVFAIADRIAVIHAGRLTAARPSADWTLAEIGLAMAGAGSPSSVSAAVAPGRSAGDALRRAGAERAATAPSGTAERPDAA